MKIKITKQHTFNYLKRLGIALLATFLLFFLLNWIFPLRDKIEYSTIVTDNKAEVVNAFITKDQKWRMKTELTEISPLLRKTINCRGPNPRVGFGVGTDSPVGMVVGIDE